MNSDRWHGCNCETCSAERSEAIRAYMAAEMERPEWVESMRRSHDDMVAGRVLPWRAMYLPGWMQDALFRIAPLLPWGRRAKKATERRSAKP